MLQETNHAVVMSIKGKQQKPNQNAYTCQPNKPFSACNQTTTSHLNYIFPLFSPPNHRGGEKYCFGADPVGVGVLVVHCLHSISWTNWWSFTKLEKTHYWEGRKKWLDIGDTDLIFKVIPVLWKFQILTKKACLHPISWSKWPILTKIHIYCNVGMD